MRTTFGIVFCAIAAFNAGTGHARGCRGGRTSIGTKRSQTQRKKKRIMERMQAWRWMLAALLLAVGETAGRAEEFAIQSFDGTGKLVFGALQGASNYEVRTSSAITGGWSVARSVTPTAANALTTTVSVAGAGGVCKVVAFMNGGSPSSERYLVIDLSAGPSATSYPVSYLSAVPVGGWTDEYKTTKLVMRRITKGAFTMGSPTGELGR
jgi:hypothetical protein